MKGGSLSRASTKNSRSDRAYGRLYTPQYRGQKTKQAKSRRKMLERIDRVEAIRDEKVGDFRLHAVTRTGDNVLSVDNLSIGLYTNVLAQAFLLCSGELSARNHRANGSGKTTLLKTIWMSLPRLAAA